MKPVKSLVNLNQAAYDQIAPNFAKRVPALTGELENQAVRFLERLTTSPGRFLDLGCGTGRDLAWFEAHGSPGFGADLSRGMLNQAGQVTRAPLSQMDMRLLGFAPSSFQAVWCCAALLHLPKSETPRALAEIARVLLPGGFLFFSVQKGDGEGLEPVPYVESTIERFFARYQPEEMTSLLRCAGFSILQQGENISNRHWLWYDTRFAMGKS